MKELGPSGTNRLTELGAGKLTPVIFVLNAASTWYMTGLIWFVQVVHYPLFVFASRENFSAFANKHCDLTGCVVVAPMIIELISSLALAFYWNGSHRFLVWVNFALVCIIWLCTALLSVPCHSRFCSTGFSASTLSFLIGSNWISTILWTVRSIILAFILSKRFSL
jgi:hypothetical protein